MLTAVVKDAILSLDMAFTVLGMSGHIFTCTPLERRSVLGHDVPPVSFLGRLSMEDIEFN